MATSEVSSAYDRNENEELHSAISFRENNRPSIKPCGTPVVISCDKDFTLTISTDCDRLIR